MNMIRLVGIAGNDKVQLFCQYPATEEDKSKCVKYYNKWKDDETFNAFKIELCSVKIVQDIPIAEKVIIYWDLPLEE